MRLTNKLKVHHKTIDRMIRQPGAKCKELAINRIMSGNTPKQPAIYKKPSSMIKRSYIQQSLDHACTTAEELEASFYNVDLYTYTVSIGVLSTNNYIQLTNYQCCIP